MPELKNTFQGGRMEKDLDERIVQNGLYREALNIEVATSEGSDVGAAQNILGNIQVTEALRGPGGKYVGSNKHIVQIVDPITDMLYRFISTESADKGVWMDRIVEYDTTKKLSDSWTVKEKAVLVDVWKVRTKCVSIQETCGITLIRVRENFAQIRYHMVLIYDDQIQEDCHINHVIWGVDGNGAYADVYLSLDITLQPWYNNDWCGADIFFAGDRALNFHPDRKITGVNILDGMLFWTDNYSEPKKVNIERGKLGSHYELLPAPAPTALNYTYEDFDKHTKLVINVDKLTKVGDIPQECVMLDEECPIPGCTDPASSNYNPQATQDDGSCIPCKYGCMDCGWWWESQSIIDLGMQCYCNDTSIWDGGQCSGDGSSAYNQGSYNYDPEYNCDDGSCCYIGGCTQSEYCNFNVNACFDDGSCAGLWGCTDPLSPDYDSSASCDDGSCTYLWECASGWSVDNCTNSSFWGGYMADVYGGTSNQQTISGGSHTTSWIQQVIDNLNDTGALLTTGCSSTGCSGVWWSQIVAGSTYNNTVGPGYFQTQPNSMGGFKCINPTSGSPGAPGTWEVKRVLTGLKISDALGMDPLNNANNTSCTAANTVMTGTPCATGWNGIMIGAIPYPLSFPTLGNTNLVLGTGTPGNTTTHSLLGMHPWSIGFPMDDNSDFSYGPNTAGYPDIITIVRFLGFDGTDPWTATLAPGHTINITNTPGYNGAYTGYTTSMSIFDIDETWHVNDVHAVVSAPWDITQGVYPRTWTQPVYPGFASGGITYTSYWQNISGLMQFTFEPIFDYCSCDGYGSCVCVKDPNGQYATYMECEQGVNCCGAAPGPPGQGSFTYGGSQ